MIGLSAGSIASEERCDEQFVLLYEQLRHEGYRYALYYLGNPEDARDAMQDAALDAYSGFSGLRSTEGFRAWFFRILAVKCRRQMKKRIDRRGLVPLPEEDALFEEMAQDPCFVAALELKEQLARLREDEREMILLAAVGGYTSAEIGELLGRPAGTVRAKMSRALARLRDESRFYNQKG